MEATIAVRIERKMVAEIMAISKEENRKKKPVLC